LRRSWTRRFDAPGKAFFFADFHVRTPISPDEHVALREALHALYRSLPEKEVPDEEPGGGETEIA